MDPELLAVTAAQPGTVEEAADELVKQGWTRTGHVLPIILRLPGQDPEKLWMTVLERRDS